MDRFSGEQALEAAPGGDLSVPGRRPAVERAPGPRLPLWRRVRRWLFYLLARLLAALARHLPRSWVGGGFAALGTVAGLVRRRERWRALQRLSWAFPRWSEERRRKVLWRSYRNLGRNLADAVRRDVRVDAAEEDRRRLEAAVHGDRPLLILSAHLGCWEQLGLWLAGSFPPIGVVTANPHNRRVDAWLRRERRALGLVTFDRRHEPRAAARWLRQGRPLVLVADHRNQVTSVEVPWFGRPAPTALGPARLARWAGARILPVGIRREQGGHVVMVGEEVQWQAEDDDATIAAACNRALEALIARAPEEWTWVHERYGAS